MANTSQVPVFQALNLSILVNNEAFAGTFDVLEIWRSPGPGFPYVEITGPSWTRARVPADGGEEPDVVVTGPQVDVVGQRLSVLVRSGDFVQIDFDFVGSNVPVLKDVASQITLQSAGHLHAYVDSLQHLVVETVVAGNAAYLQILPTDAASFLGLPTTLPDAEAFGKDGRIHLISGVSSYNFTDVAGSPTATYKTRFRNSFTGAVSESSLPFSGTTAIGISAPNLVIGHMKLVSNNGRPLPNTQVSVSSTFKGDVVEGSVVAGADLVDSTNLDGYVEFVLVRGQKYTVGIAGTNLVKDFIAPTDSSIATFSILDPTFSQQEDYFKVRVPDLPTLERRSI